MGSMMRLLKGGSGSDIRVFIIGIVGVCSAVVHIGEPYLQDHGT